MKNRKELFWNLYFIHVWATINRWVDCNKFLHIHRFGQRNQFLKNVMMTRCGGFDLHLRDQNQGPSVYRTAVGPDWHWWALLHSFMGYSKPGLMGRNRRALCYVGSMMKRRCARIRHDVLNLGRQFWKGHAQARFLPRTPADNLEQMLHGINAPRVCDRQLMAWCWINY